MDYYKKINFIDNILWINLDRSTERRTYMEEMLKNIDIPNTRIQAIDGKNEDVTKYVETVDCKSCSDSEIACTLSHLKAINQLKHIEGDYFLVLEDDVEFDNMKIIPYDFEYIIKNSPEFDILQLHKLSHNNFNNNYQKYNGWWSTTAYIISRSGINKITEKYNFENNILQNKMSEIIPSDHLIYLNGNTYTYKYNCCNSLNIESTIHNDHVNFQQSCNNIQKNIILNDFEITTL